MTVITAIFDAIVSFFEMVLAIILLILLSVVFIVYAAYHNVRPRYQITDSVLEEQGIVDLEFIDSDYQVTADYERTYSNVTREEYEEYCQYIFDYINSKGYQVCRYDGTSSELMFLFEFDTKYYRYCDDINSLYSYDGCRFEIYYPYDDDTKGVIVSYEDGNATVRLNKAGPFDFLYVYNVKYLPATEEDADVPIVADPVPEG